MGKKNGMIYHLKIAAIMLAAAGILAAGSAVVSVNCHNIINGTQMVLFDVESSDGVITVTVMGEEYIIAD